MRLRDQGLQHRALSIAPKSELALVFAIHIEKGHVLRAALLVEPLPGSPGDSWLASPSSRTPLAVTLSQPDDIELVTDR